MAKTELQDLTLIATATKWIRQTLRLTQTELARRAKTTQPIVARIENGRAAEPKATDRVIRALERAAATYRSPAPLSPKTTGGEFAWLVRAELSRREVLKALAKWKP